MGLLEELKRYLETTPREEVLKTWAKSEKYDKVGPTVDEYLKFMRFQISPPPKITVLTLKPATLSIKNENNFFGEDTDNYLSC